MQKLNKKPLLTVLFIILTVIIVLLSLLFGKPTSLTRSPSSVITSPTPSVYLKPETNHLESVSFDNLSTPTFSDSLSGYTTEIIKLSPQLAKNIGSKLGFPDTEILEDGPSLILTGENKTHYLNINFADSQISLGNLSVKYISTGVGHFSKTPDMLTIEIQSLLNKLKIFDPKLIFALSFVNYSKVTGPNFEPVPEAEADTVTLHLNPTINGNFIYLKNQSFVEATYDTEGKLIKLTLNHPITKISSLSPQNILSYGSLTKLPPSVFFTLTYNPQNLAEVYSPPEITGIDPNQISLGFLFTANQTEITPIFILESSDGLSTLYRFATPATQ